jgi:hypothetical protein
MYFVYYLLQSINPRYLINCQTVVTTFEETHGLIAVIACPQIGKECCNDVVLCNWRLETF